MASRSSDKNGGRVISIALTTEELKQAPSFKATEKTTMDVVMDEAAVLGKKTADTAVDLKNKAVKKIDEMTSGTPVKK